MEVISGTIFGWELAISNIAIWAFSIDIKRVPWLWVEREREAGKKWIAVEEDRVERDR